MFQIREKIDLSPSLIDYKFKNKSLADLTNSLPFYFLKRFLYTSGIFKSGIQKEIVYNERLVEYPYIFHQIGKYSEKIKSILDIGSNDSIIPVQLASLGYKSTSLDQIFTDNTYHPEMKFICADFFENEIPDSSFDCVISISVIEHMGIGYYGDKQMENADLEAFREVYRILKPGGIAVITVPVYGENTYWRDKITLFTDQRIEEVTENYQILDKQILSKKTHNQKDTNYQYFSPREKDFTDHNVWLLTLKKPE